MKEAAIGVVALGRVPETVSGVVAAHIEGYLDLTALRLPPAELPASCLDTGRMQYDAAKLLEHLEKERLRRQNQPAEPACTKIIGLLTEDIFLPLFTHVFGEAQQDGGCAVVSLYRLSRGADNTRAPDAIIYRRTAKVALHEAGHLFNLYHCSDPQCLMHFSSDLEVLDAAAMDFCPYCAEFFREARRRARTLNKRKKRGQME
jgi:archaemetzincin